MAAQTVLLFKQFFALLSQIALCCRLIVFHFFCPALEFFCRQRLYLKRLKNGKQVGKKGRYWGRSHMLNALTEKRTRGSILWDYLTTVDHKKIAILYLIAGGFFFLVGGIEAMFIRIQLAKPENAFLSAQAYNEVMTMHGTTMIFLAAMPLLFALMNAVVPLQIGARDVSFPFLNSLSVFKPFKYS